MALFILCAPADRPVAEALKTYAESRARLVDVRDLEGPAPYVQAGDALIALISRESVFSPHRMRFDKSCLEAWEENRLVLVKLDHAFAPVGLRDLPFIDASFEAQRDFAWGKVLAEAAAKTQPKPQTKAPDAAAPHPEPPIRRAPAKAAKPGLLGGIFGGVFSKKRAPAGGADTGGADTGGTERQEGPPAAAAPAPAPGRAEQSQAALLFISYAHADSDSVRPLVAIVEAKGEKVWIDKQGIVGGENWAGEIVRAIKAAKGVLVMCSKRALESDHVRRELYLADRYKKKLLPVLLEPVEFPEDFEYFFAGVQWLAWHSTPESERETALAKALTLA